jgi:hypothetical protein
MIEYVILPENERWKHEYFKDIGRMAEVYKLSEDFMGDAVTLNGWKLEDIKEPLLLFDEVTHRFKKNIGVEYSSYLTDYGFERPDQYSDRAKIATRLNNVVKSIDSGKKMKKLNDEAIALGIKFYPAVEQILNRLKEEYANKQASAEEVS